MQAIWPRRANSDYCFPIGKVCVQMNILISAFAFAPNVGSEPGVGWRWAAELGREHHVTVVTDVTRRPLVEADGVQLPPNVRVVYFRPAWLRGIPLNSATAQILYTLWQFTLLGFARRLHNRNGFDLAMHITYGVYRHPSFLGYLGIPFIFGPLGGGEDAPLALKRSIVGREKIKELLRALANRAALFDPFLWAAYAKATVILTKTEETRVALPWPFRHRAIVYPEIGVDAPARVQPRARQPREPLRVLFVGRLVGWKGAHLAIRAVARAIEQGTPIEFTLVGKGPFEPALRKVAAELNILAHIRWVKEMPQQDLFALYGTMHCFLFPSLHDSSGNVVLEAQASALPVVCLDLGGPATLVTARSAIVVATRGRSELALVQAMADALCKLTDEGYRTAMARAAIAHAVSMNWSNRVSGALRLL
jgi:glycosyltransferase involved in cell wall biosynthesis